MGWGGGWGGVSEWVAGVGWVDGLRWGGWGGRGVGDELPGAKLGCQTPVGRHAGHLARSQGLLAWKGPSMACSLQTALNKAI